MMGTPEKMRRVKHAINNCNELIVFDCETTGLSPSQDRIIEIAAIKYAITNTSPLVLEEKERLWQYIKPPFPISDEIVAITGITNDLLNKYHTEEWYVGDIVKFFGTCPSALCAHNANFDLGFMRYLYERSEVGSLEPYYVLDTMNIARDCVSREECGRYKLESLAKVFNIDDEAKFHSAMDDALVTAKLLMALYNQRYNIA